ncbi:MAG TPA: GNAT family N-acetyltransferase [Gemmatimonadales bacterium]|nr:GNAT family N-acetyltransferase [Gemmatimonadales bacterium]
MEGEAARGDGDRSGGRRPIKAPSSITVRPGVANDAAALAELAAATFRDAFGADNDPADLALHLARSYGVAQQTAELAHPAITTLVASVDAELTGYAQLRLGQPPACVTAARPLELWRFYVARPWHGRGVAQELMAAAIAAARGRGAASLWLGVWARNPRAQAFYKKSGFVDVGSQTFFVGTDPQTDRVMELIL